MHVPLEKSRVYDISDTDVEERDGTDHVMIQSSESIKCSFRSVPFFKTLPDLNDCFGALV